MTFIAMTAVGLGYFVAFALLRPLALFAQHEVVGFAHTNLTAPLLAVIVAFVTVRRTLCLDNGMRATVLDRLALVSYKFVARLANAFLVAGFMAVWVSCVAVLVALGANHLVLATFKNWLALAIH